MNLHDKAVLLFHQMDLIIMTEAALRNVRHETLDEAATIAKQGIDPQFIAEAILRLKK